MLAYILLLSPTNDAQNVSVAEAGAFADSQEPSIAG